MIIIAPLDRVDFVMDRHRPSAVISVLDRIEEAPALAGLSHERHLKLPYSMLEAQLSTPASAKERDLLQSMVDFAGALPWDAPLLIHCRLGISRSPAAALIVQCALSPARPETQFAEELREISPHVDPNMGMIAVGDDLLSREGRLIDAVCMMEPARSCFVGEVIEIPYKPISN